MRIFVVMLLVAGCGKGSSSGDGGGGTHDLTLPSDLAQATGDMVHPLAGITCGNMQCAATAQYCCTADSGDTGTCDAVNDFNCTHTFFYCDGPEDCPPALGECCVENGSASCMTPGNCATMGGTLMCHKLSDCASETGTKCCPNTSVKGSPYELCLASTC
jgi:hypothetical protein